ncbi:DsbE family thiol:disulfide interchange protein [Alsobacter sp. SYSU M60028]|uniref:DsbE family thiol:disulfide interchange protein n=1 Tax=Alsobacter ponti TaxID=2962936 RepID=A0ABT1LII2_9HYPH|nr:DsbE family thiol:disulfide interchange protein [Alsobacter ponti]MCP8940520.1 DsbE family thiol:disulfide interchange protein [Alsobacter ponti]
MSDDVQSPPAAPSRRRLAVALPLLVFAALALLFLFRLFGGDPSRLPSALIGRPVPEFTLPPVAGLARDGKPTPGLSSADLKGGVTVVNVWASWCVPCRDEHPLLVELAAKPGVRLVGINYKDQAENARRFLGALGNPFSAVGADTAGRAAIDWGVYGVPETFIVAKDGTIAYKHVGPLSPEALKGRFAEEMAKAAAR